MRSRPLIQKGIVDLEKMFSESQRDQPTLRQLRTELKHRKLARAFVLLKKVEAALVESEHLSGMAAVSTQVVDLFSSSTENSVRSSGTEAVRELGEDTKPAQALTSITARQPVMSMPDAASQSERLERRSQPNAPVSLTLEQACRVLGVASSSSWEIVEQARRTLVERARPDLVADFSEEQREKMQTEAHRVNLAYATLARARMKSGEVAHQ